MATGIESTMIQILAVLLRAIGKFNRANYVVGKIYRKMARISMEFLLHGASERNARNRPANKIFVHEFMHVRLEVRVPGIFDIESSSRSIDFLLTGQRREVEHINIIFALFSSKSYGELTLCSRFSIFVSRQTILHLTFS